MFLPAPGGERQGRLPEGGMPELGFEGCIGVYYAEKWGTENRT